MSDVQSRNDVQIRQFHLSGELKSKDSCDFKQDATRSGDIVALTVVTQDPATLLWVPLVDASLVDGTGAPKGILAQAITEADIKAGNVVDQLVIVGGSAGNVDKDLLVFDGATVELTEEVIALNITVEGALNQLGIFPQATDYRSQLENA